MPSLLRTLAGTVSMAGALTVPIAAAPLPEAATWLPDSFEGVLLCGDCEGLRSHLDLWPDGVFHLKRDFIGKQGSDDELGRWRKDPVRPVILLYGGREMPLQFEWVAPGVLRPLGHDGKPLAAGTASDLRTTGRLRPAELHLPLHGMFVDLADGARFDECLTGRLYPVAMEADSPALQAAYAVARQQPGERLLASFDGSIESRPAMQGPVPVPTVVVRRFVGVWPGQRCERAMSHASLVDQYWRIVSLRGLKVVAADGQREPHLVLRSQDGRFQGAIGCERVAGRYRVDGPHLRIEGEAGAEARPCAAGAGPATTPAAALDDVLGTARRWRIHAQVLEWFDESGASIALFEAVYLR